MTVSLKLLNLASCERIGRYKDRFWGWVRGGLGDEDWLIRNMNQRPWQHDLERRGEYDAEQK